MNKQDRNKTARSPRGFTIIEVVLVLAIAGLIFLMVFIALPALQRSQRDTQRKQDLARISTQLTNYASSSRGQIPDQNSIGSFVRGYLGGSSDSTAGDNYQDPSGSDYTIQYKTTPTSVGQVGYYDKSSCDASAQDGSGVSPSTATRDYALTIRLENQSAPYCVDNKS